MSSIQAAYVNALLADAAYKDFVDDSGAPLTASAVLVNLTARLTAAQAQYLLANFDILTQTLSPSEGFDAVVWRGKAGTEYAGQVYVSMRGTQGGQDIADDISLASRGVPYNQIRDMVNWWLRNTAAEGEEAIQINVLEAPGVPGAYTFVLGTPVAGTGVLADVDAITAVNGHSLGGYLSTAFTRLFGAAWDVQSVNTFNSAGFNSLASLNTEIEFSNIANLIGASLGLGGWDAVGDIQTNYFAENGISVTTNSWADFHFLTPGFHQYGERVGLNQEDLLGGNPIANHSMFKQTDLLALGAVLERLDSSMDVERLNALIQIGSNQMEGSYEAVLDGLRRQLLGADDFVATPISDGENDSYRAAYQGNIHDLLERLSAGSSDPQSLSAFAGNLTLTAAAEGDNLESQAKTDFGTFLALQFLSPVVISTTDAGALVALKAVHASLAVDWQTDMNARLYGDTGYEFAFSEQWYADRALLLATLLKVNEKDLSAPAWLTDAGAPADRDLVFHYTPAGETVPSGQSTADIVGLSPDSASRADQEIFFGTDKAETLSGTNNTVFGDRLYGGRGNDSLKGLAGDDHLEGQSGDDLLEGGEGHDTLLGGAGDDVLRGDAGNDLLIGGAGHDVLGGGEGNDQLYGGSGNDYLYGAEGNDFFSGGTGSDTLEGGEGSDYLFDQSSAAETAVLRGEAGSDLLDARLVSGAATLDGGTGSDWIRAGSGINSIFGGAGADLIEGGSAKDVVLGGAGADHIITGEGDDDISGGTGADYLQGGQGADTYRLEASNGTDLINDQQGANVLVFSERAQGANWSASYNPAKGAWVTADGYVIRRYTLGTTTTLAIHKDGDSQNTVYLKDWSAGQYGISLSGEEAQPQAPQSAPQPVTSRADNNHVDHVVGNDAVAGEQGNDILQGTDAASVLSGGIGNDILDGRGGADWLEGGQGSDIILSGSGQDTAYGGGDDDLMRAGYSFDMTFGQIVGTGEPALFWRAGENFTANLKAGGNTASVFTYRYKKPDGSIEVVAIPHPELALFDISIAKEWDETTQSYVYWWDADNANVRIEPSLTLTLTLGDPLDVVQGKISEHAPDEVGQAKTYELLLGGSPDVLAAGTGAQGVRFWGGDGNDILYGANDHDKLYGEADDDILIGYGGDDELHGGDGKDTLWGGAGRDFLDGGSEDDKLIGGHGADVLYGGDGDDTLVGDATYLYGTDWYPSGDDQNLHGGDYLHGGAGNDRLWGDFGDDYLFGGADNDKLYGGAGDDHLWGEGGQDTLGGGDGDDYLDGGEQADYLDGGAGSDVLLGGGGSDTLHGGADDDILSAGEGADILIGGAGSDKLSGGAGDDYLYGDGDETGDGADMLEGGQGQDHLAGGGGADLYVFSLGDGQDIIVDDGSDGSRNLVVFRFSPAEVTEVVRNGVDLHIRYGAGDSVTALGFYGRSNPSQGSGVDRAGSGDAQYMVAEVHFDDGTVWTADDLLAMAPPPEPVDSGEDPFAHLADLYFVDALLDRDEVRSAGKHTLSYSFATSFDSGLTGAYLFNDTQKAAVREALARYSAVADIAFVEVAHGVDADLSFYLDDLRSNNMGGFSGYASAKSGEIHLNSSLYAQLFEQEAGGWAARASLAVGESGFETLLHEIGHALGLKHPFEQPYLPVGEENNTNTVMSYTRPNGPATDLMPFDVAALQYLYGVAQGLGAGDSTYTLADRFISDAGGADTLDLSAETEAVTVDLAPGSWIHRGDKAESILADGQAFIGFGTEIENLVGGSGSDTLAGNALANRIGGGAGDDTLRGGAGDDTLAGGDGADTYVFTVGDGNDTIEETGSDTRLVIHGVAPASVYYAQGALYAGESGGRIVIAREQIAELLVDGQSHTGADLERLLNVVVSDSGDLTLAEGQDQGRLLGDSDWGITGTSAGDHLTGNTGGNVLQGLGGDDTLLGGAGDDQLHGDEGQDVLLGGDGNDTLQGGEGGDSLDGGAGDDSLDGGTGADVLDGGIGNDALLGGEGDDHLDGGEGQDLLLGGDGNDTLLGGEGDDSLSGEAGDDSLDGGTGADVLDGGAGNDVLLGGDGNDTLLGGEGDDSLSGEAGDDSLHGGAGADVLDGGAGNDALLGGDGSDTLLGGEGDDSLSGEAGDDSLDGGTGADVLDGGAGNDVLLGGEGDDHLDGGEGQDLLLGGDGNDTLLGGEGDDSLSGGAGDDSLHGGAGADVIDGGAGNDALLGGDGNDTLLGGEGDDSLSGEAGDDSLDGGTGADVLDGGAGNDVLLGGDGNDTLLGGDGADALFGGDGDDWLEGGQGVNTLTGGRGSDTLVGGDAATIYAFASGDGRDHVFDALTNEVELLVQGVTADEVRFARTDAGLVVRYGADFADEVLIENIWQEDRLVQNIVIELDSGERKVFDTAEMLSDLSLRGGEGDDLLVGTALNDTILGGAGNDSLSGEAGDDHLDGGLGDDVLDGGSGNDVLLGGAGRDLLDGGVGDDTLLASDGDDSLQGGDGNDSLNGEAGNDRLDGGSGDDVLDGGGGDDTLFGGGGNDRLDGGEGQDVLLGEAGDDTLQGGEGDDTLRGGEGRDVLSGGGGQNTYVYTVGDGEDVLVDGFEAEINLILHGVTWDGVAFAQDGTDIVLRFEEASGDEITVRDIWRDHQLRQAIRISLDDGEVYVLDSAALLDALAIKGTEGDDHLSGTTGNDTLLGLGGNDYLFGKAGDDFLDGGLGADTMEGGDGGDRYLVDDPGDVVLERKPEYLRHEAQIFSWNLHLEPLELAVVQSHPDYLYYKNLIDARGGYENIAFDGDGKVTLVVFNINEHLDGYDENPDVVDSSIDYRLPQGVEHLNLLGDGDVSGIGNEYRNQMIGNAGNNLIVGDPFDGSERRYGNISTQHGIEFGLAVRNAASELLRDKFRRVEYEQRLTYDDVVQGDGVFVENLPGDYLDGREGDDRIFGGLANDTLIGGEGNDVLSSGGGSDWLYGGTGDDVYVIHNYGYLTEGGANYFIGYLDPGEVTVVEADNEGFDTVYTNQNYTLGAGVESLVLYEDLLDLPGEYVDPTLLEAWPRSKIDFPGRGTIGHGNELNNIIAGSNMASELYGHEGDDTLYGGSRNDTLDGGSGADFMEGGYGSDHYFVDDEGDVVFEGHDDYSEDIVTTTLMFYELPEWVENLYLVGDGEAEGWGNWGNNLIVGNGYENILFGLDGDDTLDGGAGDDYMNGGWGNDTYIVSQEGDVVDEFGADGHDHVLSHIEAYTLTEGVEDLTLLGEVALRGTGNDLDNRIEGNAQGNLLIGLEGADTLIGAEGVDTLIGGSGDDVYEVRAVGPSPEDLVVEAANEGVDTIILTPGAVSSPSSVSHVKPVSVTIEVPDHVENMDASALEADLLVTGNAENNQIMGGAGRDVIWGMDGDDYIAGDIYESSAQLSFVDGGSVAAALGAIIQATGFEPSAELSGWAFFKNSMQLLSELPSDADPADFVEISVRHLDGLGGYSQEFWFVPIDRWGWNYAQAEKYVHWSPYGVDLMVDQAGRMVLDLEEANPDSFQASLRQWVYRPESVLAALQVTHDVTYAQASLPPDGYVRVTAPFIPEWDIMFSQMPGLDWRFDSLSMDIQQAFLAASEVAYADTLYGGNGDDHIDGGIGNDLIDGGEGDDYIFGGHAGFVNVVSNSEFQPPDENQEGEYVSISNYDAPDEDDTIDGGAGNDYVDGGAGNDLIYGGEGNDFLYGGDDESASLGGLVPEPPVEARMVADLVLVGVPFNHRIKHLTNDDVIHGGIGDDTIDGGSGDDYLYGGEGNDVIFGGADGWLNHSNNDYLDGGAGLDWLEGGTGDDVYIVDGTWEVLPSGVSGTALVLCDAVDRFGVDAGPKYLWETDTVVEYEDEGYDTVWTSASIFVENVEEVRVLDSVSNPNIDVVTGKGAQLLVGNAGNNVLDGGEGADTMIGGAGDDSYWVDDAGDVVIENADGGFDVIRTSLDVYKLAEHLEGLVLEGTAKVGLGNGVNNYLVGNDQNNALYGLDGDDTLAGWRGSDTLYGGAGNDTYLFARGDGLDVIVDTDGQGTIRFSGDITSSDLHLALVDGDLVIDIRSSGQWLGDRIIIAGWTGSDERVATLAFCDEPPIDIGSETGRISGYVYLDDNDDALRQTGEPGLAGVVITLQGVDDLGRSVNTTTVTGVDGAYVFEDLRAGTYSVIQTQPEGYLDGQESVGSSGGVAGNDVISGISLVAAQHSQENNFGERLDAQSVIGDRVFLDCNNNGVQDEGERGVDGVTVHLLSEDGRVLDTQTTDAQGQYRFTGLEAGSYAVQVVAPQGYGFAKQDQGSDDLRDSDVNAATGETAIIAVDGRQEALGWDAGLVASPVGITYDFSGCSATDGTDGNSRVYVDAVTGVSVSATAWSRDKSNGKWAKAFLGAYSGGHGVTDSAEGKGSGVTHTIDNSGRDNFVVYQFSQDVTVDKALLGYVYNDSDMSIWIGSSAVPLGQMSNSVLASLGFTEINLGGSSARWADFNQGNVSGNVLVVSARNGESNDYFKLEKLAVWVTPAACEPEPVPLSSLGSRVWCDTNGNGIQDEGEPGVAGVAVKLLDAQGQLVASTTTDAQGAYLFEGLSAGSYQIQVTAPVAYGGLTRMDQGGDERLDSDVDASTGRSATIVVGIGEHVTGWDAGLKPPMSTVDLCFSGNSSTDGSDGNSRTLTAGGVTVTATAWSRDKSRGTWTKAYAGSYSGGLGVTDSSEGRGSGVSHTLDNSGRDNFLVYQFSEAVVVDKAYLGYVYNDSDVTIWIGNHAGPITSMSNATLASLGFTEVNLGGSSARWADVNASGLAGNVLVIAAREGESNDYVKVEQLRIQVASRSVTPIVIDLNGDGIQTTGRESSAGTFDLLGSGDAVRSGWISAEDGFLALDANGNGRIDDISELFGGITRGDGFVSLAALDSNGDGLVDALDERFGELLVWQDANGDHQSQETELHGLQSLGIESLETGYRSTATLDAFGNLLGETGTARMRDGTLVQMSDVYFAVDGSDLLNQGIELPTLEQLLAQPAAGEVQPDMPVSLVEIQSQVDGLIQAMASESFQTAGESTLPVHLTGTTVPMLAESLV